MLAALAAASVLAAAGTAPPPPPAATFVGTPICVRCHIDFARRWEGLEHSKKMLDPALPPERSGCEACHGPGSDHVAGNRRQIVRWAELQPGEKADRCLQCHTDKIQAEQWKATLHAELLGCDSCHEVHRPVQRDKMLKMAEGAECTECHGDLPEEVEKQHHHSLVDGALACNMCHQFHGSANARLLMLPQQELCQECHPDQDMRPASHQAETFRLGHGEEAKADREKCLMCHDEATSCQSCHVVNVPHPGDFAVAHTEVAKQHLAACLRCHEEDYCKLCHEDVPKPEAAGQR